MADIALNDWINFKNKMARLSQTAADKFTDYINNGGGYANMPIEDVIEYATAIVQKYGEGEGALAAMMYDAIAELSGAAVPPAEIALLPTYGDVAKAIQGAAKTSELSGYLGAVAGRLVKQVGADTTLQNAERDGAQFAWIPMGDTCAFCLTLASRGWRYISKQAMKNGHAEHIHANCDCQYAVRFNKNTNVEGYDPDKYKKMYDDADGNTPKERINSMRREFYAKNKANGLKNLESSAAEETYVRMGQISPSGKSLNWYALTLDEQADVDYALRYGDSLEDALFRAGVDKNRKGLFEEGISVFKADNNGLPELENLQQVTSLVTRIDDSIFDVTGEAIGTGTDNEPILAKAKATASKASKDDLIEKIEKTLADNYENVEITDDPYPKSDRISVYEDGDEVWYNGKIYRKAKPGWRTERGAYAYKKR